MATPKTNNERVHVIHRWNANERRNEYIIAYDKPRSKKLTEVKVFKVSDPAMNDEVSTAAYNFRAGFVTALDLMESK